MEIIRAKTAGFCFGVRNAVRLLNDLIEKTDEPVYTLGPIIHNTQVVERFAAKNVKVVNDIDDIKEPGYVVIRAHGISPVIYDKLIERGHKVIDATCPDVAKIHKIVRQKYDEGYQIAIVGDKNHPEVIGINSWCNETAYIINGIEEVEALEDNGKQIFVVAQTTITKEKWEKVNDTLKKRFENAIKFDTICNATSKHQNEAENIAKDVDIMLVIGGKNSSNTQKLFEICSKYCGEVYKIETSGELPPMDIKKIKKIGITAGASTPDWVIEEVISKMSELNKQDNEMSFKEAFESSLVTLNNGDVVKGKVIGFNNNEVFVDLGFKSDGIVPKEEFTDDPDFDPQRSLKIGDEIEVMVLRVNDGEGNVLLSKKKVDALKSWDSIEKAYEDKTPIKAKVIDVVNGGVIASTSGIRIFVPASQISDRFVKDLNEFMKKVITVRIVEYNKQKRKLVGSQRVILEEQRKSAAIDVWNNIEVGKRYTGTVKSIMDFGAFVDIGGVDGLVHISELSWTKIKHPSAVLKVGDQVEVSILEFDKDKKKISLGYRKNEDNPWTIAAEKYKVGDVVKGTVVRLVPFGAFVELEKGVDALVHISQISNKRIGKPDDVLKIGQEIEAKIIEVNIESKKISISIKDVNPIDPVSKNEPESTPADAEELPSEHKEEMGNTIGDALTKETTSEE